MKWRTKLFKYMVFMMRETQILLYFLFANSKCSCLLLQFCIISVWISGWFPKMSIGSLVSSMFSAFTTDEVKNPFGWIVISHPSKLSHIIPLTTDLHRSPWLFLQQVKIAQCCSAHYHPSFKNKLPKQYGTC